MTDSVPAVVHLVGAGPGDPLLLTRRAADLVGAADVVVADRRSNDPILTLAPAAAERVYVGRVDRQPPWSLDAIADCLAAHARAGRTVVRLKAGDPFVCSRGGEEVDALRARGIACEVTPGVTAATAAPLLVGLRLGAAVAIASGDDDPMAPPVPWSGLSDPAASVVVLTGRAHQGRIAAALVGAGLPVGTPVAVIHAATRPSQCHVRTDLAGLGATRLPAPALFVVGPSSPAGARAHP